MGDPLHRQQHSPPSLPAADGFGPPNNHYHNLYFEEFNHLRTLLFSGNSAKEKRFVSEYLDYFVNTNGPFGTVLNEFHASESPFELAVRLLFSAARHAVNVMKDSYPPSTADDSWHSNRFFKKLTINHSMPFSEGGQTAVELFSNLLHGESGRHVPSYLLYATSIRFIEFHVKYHLQLMQDNRLESQYSSLCNFATYGASSALDWLNSPRFVLSRKSSLNPEKQKQLLIRLFEAFPVEKYDGVRPLSHYMQVVDEENEKDRLKNNNNRMAPSVASTRSSLSGSVGVPSVSGGGTILDDKLPEVSCDGPTHAVPAVKREVSKMEAKHGVDSTSGGSGKTGLKKQKISDSSSAPAGAVSSKKSSGLRAVTPPGMGALQLPMVEDVDDAVQNEPAPSSFDAGRQAGNSTDTSAEPIGMQQQQKQSTTDSAVPAAVVAPAEALLRAPSVASISSSSEVCSSSSNTPSKRRRRPIKDAAYALLKAGVMQRDDISTRVQTSPKFEPIVRNNNSTVPVVSAGPSHASSSLAPAAAIVSDSGAVAGVNQIQNGLETGNVLAAVLPLVGTENAAARLLPPVVPTPVQVPTAPLAPSTSAASSALFSHSRRSSSLLYELVKTEPPEASVPVDSVVAPTAIAAEAAVASTPAENENSAQGADGGGASGNAMVGNSQAPLIVEQQQVEQPLQHRVKTEPLAAPATSSPVVTSNAVFVAPSSRNKTERSTQNAGANSAAASPAAGPANAAGSSSTSSGTKNSDRNRRSVPVPDAPADDNNDDKSLAVPYDQREAVNWSKQFDDKVFEFLITSCYRDLYSLAGQQLLPRRATMSFQELRDIYTLFFDTFCVYDTKGMEWKDWKDTANRRIKPNAATGAAEAPEHSSHGSGRNRRSRRSLSPASTSSSSSAHAAPKSNISQQKTIDYCVKFLEWLRAKVRVSSDENDDDENSPNSTENNENDDDMADSASVESRPAVCSHDTDTYSIKGLPSPILYEQRMLDVMLRVTLCRLKRPVRSMSLKFVCFCCRLCSERNVGDASEHFKTCAAAKSHREAAENAPEQQKIAGMMNTIDMLIDCPLCTAAGMSAEVAEFRLSHIGEHFRQNHDLFELETLHDTIDAKQAGAIPKKKRLGSVVADENENSNNDMPTKYLKFIKQSLPVAVMCDECDQVFTQISRYAQHIAPSRNALSGFQQPVPLYDISPASYRSLVWKKFFTKIKNTAPENTCSCTSRFTCKRRLPLLVLPAKGKQAFALPLEDFHMLLLKHMGKVEERSNAPFAASNSSCSGLPVSISRPVSVNLTGSVPSSPTSAVQQQNLIAPGNLTSITTSSRTLSNSTALTNNIQPNITAAFQMPTTMFSSAAGASQMNTGQQQPQQYQALSHSVPGMVSSNFAGMQPQFQPMYGFVPAGVQLPYLNNNNMPQNPYPSSSASPYGMPPDYQPSQQEFSNNYQPMNVGGYNPFVSAAGRGGSINMRANAPVPPNNNHVDNNNFAATNGQIQGGQMPPSYTVVPNANNNNLVHHQQQQRMQAQANVMQQQQHEQQMQYMRHHQQQQQRIGGGSAAASSSSPPSSQPMDMSNKTTGTSSSADPQLQSYSNVAVSSYFTNGSNTHGHPSGMLTTELPNRNSAERTYMHNQSRPTQQQQQHLFQQQQASLQQQRRRGSSAINTPNPGFVTAFATGGGNNSNMASGGSMLIPSTTASGGETVLSSGVVPARKQ